MSHEDLVLTVALATGISLLSAAGVAYGDPLTCRYECPGHGCLGGCSVSTNPPCSVSCGGGACTYNCKITGMAGCADQQFGQCDIQPRISGDRGGLGWAVFDYPLDRESAELLGGIRVLNGTSEAFMIVARQHLGQALLDALPRRAGVGSPGRAVGLWVAPLDEASQCARYDHRFIQGRPEDVASGKFIYRALTDGSGEIDELQILHTHQPEMNEVVERFIRSHVQVWSTEGYERIEFFGSINVVENGSVSFAIAGAGVPPLR